MVANAFPYEFEIDYIRIYQSLTEEFLWQWGNEGNGKIALWDMNLGDQFIAGDFDNDGRDELLAIAQNGWSHLMKFDGSNWQWVWGNDGGKTIDLWHMKPTDMCLSADFDGDGNTNLLAISTNGWAHLLQMSSILQF
jgi:hypothetical protein